MYIEIVDGHDYNMIIYYTQRLNTQWHLFSCSIKSGGYVSNNSQKCESSAATSILSPEDPTETFSAMRNITYYQNRVILENMAKKCMQ